jgi:predicted dehydrogenase
MEFFMIKCGIIGCGVIAPTHLAGYKQIPGVKVAALCDLVKEKTEKAAADFPDAQIYTDYRKLLANPDIDAVSICTDHASHAEIVCETLKAGKHLICEKVPARTREDAELMYQCAKEHPDVIASGIFQHRFNPANIALRQIIRSGKLGKLLTVNLNFACLRTNEYYTKDAWRGTVAGEGGGVLINQAIHFLDQLRFLFGNVQRVSAISANLTHQGVIEVEDTVAFTAQFTSGVFVTANATNSASAAWRSALTICGSEVQLEFIDEKLSHLSGNNGENVEAIRAELENADNAEKVHGKSYYGAGHTAQLANFIDAITNRNAPEVSLADALDSAALVHAVYESCASGKWCEVPQFTN